MSMIHVGWWAGDSEAEAEGDAAKVGAVAGEVGSVGELDEEPEPEGGAEGPAVGGGIAGVAMLPVDVLEQVKLAYSERVTKSEQPPPGAWVNPQL